MRYVKGIVKARNAPVSAGPRKRAISSPPMAVSSDEAILLLRSAATELIVWRFFAMPARMEPILVCGIASLPDDRSGVSPLLTFAFN
jgi:hypothetical protein